jgi:sulfite reductase (NADPH) flavoprotein alpha-component
MTISVWRYSHLALAVSSFLFITLAAVTGIILSFEPVSQKMQSYRADHFNQISLAQTLPVLRKTYPDISGLTVDANQFVIIKATDANGKNMEAYVNPLTGKVLGKKAKPNEFFQWVTSLHRSLFLHETGRFLVGLTAFFLLLIAISGTVLVIQRQRGIKRFFTKIVRENFAQYYHVVLGRLSLIPILIIALTGSYLSVTRFGIIPEPKKITHKIDFDELKSTPEKKQEDFEVFKHTHLSQVQSVEFPFSEDVEDYYTIKLDDREIVVNQLTGDVLSNIQYSKMTLYTNLSLNLHTGRASAIWAIVLAIAALNILFFIYSGFVIMWKRRANRVKNKHKANESKFIILVGSENGTTLGFANAVHQQLLKRGLTSHITELNNYQIFPNAEHLIVITATYGLGNAPTNSTKFEALVKKHQQLHEVKFSVVGFGSHAYPDFCKFAFEVNNLLSGQEWAVPLLEIHTVNDKAPAEFIQWAGLWSQVAGLPFTLVPELISQKPAGLQTLTVLERTPVAHEDGAFLIRLQPKRRLKFCSGDLLAIYPANDYRERLYSIGKVDNQLQLSVKLHTNGLGSGFLYHLQPGNTISARITGNKHFHFPQKAKRVVMISNGTGIAPFLGMMEENVRKIDCHLYCGFRDAQSFELYQDIVDRNLAAQHLNKVNVAYSREGERQYVKDLLQRDEAFMANILAKGGIVMICGSLAMQNNVIELLESVCQTLNNKSISYYQSHGQVLMDCY